MALLGERVLPDAVNSRRRQLRARVQDLRQPVRDFRQRVVPGDFDVVGMVESNVADLRDRFVTRTSVLERIRSRRQNQNTGNSDVQDMNSSDDNTDQVQ